MSPLPESLQSSLYGLLRLPLRPAAEAWALHARLRGRGLEADQRRGRGWPPVAPGALWLHGASLGEARIVLTLARALDGEPLALSAMTAAGRAEQERGGLPGAFAPLDLRAYVDRVFDAVRPAMLVPVETELWPQLLGAARRREVPTVLLNARLSADRMRRYERWSALYRPIVAGMTRIGARSQADAERFARLGAPERALAVTGDIKFDAALPAVDAAALRARLRPGERRLLVAGSTREGEERIVLEAFKRLDREGLGLAIAPRHLERVDAVAARIEAAGLSCRRWSEPAGDGEVLLLDVLGELAGLYAIAEIAFVGGTLVPIGGHNVLEPAAHGVPVLVGPHTAAIADSLTALREAGAAREVADAAALAEALESWLGDEAARAQAGRAARAVVDRHRGATERSLRLIDEARR